MFIVIRVAAGNIVALLSGTGIDREAQKKAALEFDPGYGEEEVDELPVIDSLTPVLFSGSPFLPSIDS